MTDSAIRVRKYVVSYPSGQRLELYGELHGGMLGDQFAVGLVIAHGQHLQGRWVSPGAIVVFDPRVYVKCTSRHVHYDPHNHLKELPGRMRRWLRVNRWWSGAASELGSVTP